MSAPNLSTATVVDPATLPGAVGFSVPSATLDLVLVKDRASTNKYTGLQVSLTNASLVGEQSNDGDATYVYASTVGHEDLYDLADLTTTPTTILAV